MSSFLIWSVYCAFIFYSFPQELSLACCLAWPLTLKVEAVPSCETSVNVSRYTATHCRRCSYFRVTHHCHRLESDMIKKQDDHNSHNLHAYQKLQIGPRVYLMLSSRCTVLLTSRWNQRLISSKTKVNIVDIRFAVIQFRRSFSLGYVVFEWNGGDGCSWYLERNSRSISLFVCVWLLKCAENGIAISYVTSIAATCESVETLLA
jgi:hypothetical protein